MTTTEEKETGGADDTTMTARTEGEDTTVAQGARDEDTTENEAHGKKTHHHHRRQNEEDVHTRIQTHLHLVALAALYLRNKTSSARETTLLQQSLSWKSRSPTSTRQDYLPKKRILWQAQIPFSNITSRPRRANHQAKSNGACSSSRAKI